MITWSKPVPVQLTVKGWLRWTVLRELKFVTVKLAGIVVLALNEPTCVPPAPVNVYVPPFWSVPFGSVLEYAGPVGVAMDPTVDDKLGPLILSVPAFSSASGPDGSFAPAGYV